METLIASIITGGLALAGVIITNMMSNRKVEAQLDKAQAVTETKLENLTTEVRKHNDFANRIPVIEEKITVANHRIDDLERKVEKYEIK